MNTQVKNLIDDLNSGKKLSKENYEYILSNYDKEDFEYIKNLAKDIAIKNFGKDIYFRGIIEFSNICKNDCLYCGIRRSNSNVERYRLTKEQILECCEEGYEFGYRTFVLQSGEDGYFSDEVILDVVKSIREKFKDC